MTIIVAAAAAALSIGGAIGHSVISERKFLRPLYAEPRTGLFASRSARAITRGIFHMPSMVWVVLGLGVLAARIEGGNVLLSIVAATIFTASGAGNLVALRRPHISGLLLVVTGALTLADLML
jgi:uncharacterized membrane protein